jgi:glc operon protein GlcG
MSIDARGPILYIELIPNGSSYNSCEPEEKTMIRIFMPWLIGVIFALGSTVAWAQQTLQTMAFGPPIGNEAAKKIGAAAAAEARKNGWPVCIAVVDYHGELVYFERLDNTQLGGVGVAMEKARTAARFKRATKVLEDGVAGGRNALLRLGDAIPIQGGLPIVVDGKFIGAIGVSGVTSQQDEQVAAAGLAALK